MATLAINGFGRIGRTFFRMAWGNPNFDIVAINDLGNLENLAYLLKYDTVYGHGPYSSIQTEGGKLVVEGKEINFISEREPEQLPWGDMGIDIVLEATGFFASYDKSKAHLNAGAKRVIISAPVKDDPTATEGVTGATVLMGVNDATLSSYNITSNASCTTNATSPLIAILKEKIGIEKALLNTVHAYTSTQSLIDGSKKDFRKGRAAAQNMIPTSTGAAVATTKAHPELDGLFDGIAVRVPVLVGSIVDVTFIAKRETSVEEVNQALSEAAASDHWCKLFAVTNEQLVSSDIIGSEYASIADLSFTRVVGGNLVKVLAWYDNETSYTSTLVSHIEAVAKFFNAN